MDEGKVWISVFGILICTADFGKGLHRWTTHRSIICKNNGALVNGRCVCIGFYTGTYCDRSMYCKMLQIYPNGSCIDCEDGWMGSKCDWIQCVHGEPDSYGQYCICDKPYSGKLCTDLKTTDIYSYYNHKICAFGPIGIFLIIPLVLILYGCERMAQSRRKRRIEKCMYEQEHHG